MRGARLALVLCLAACGSRVPWDGRGSNLGYGDAGDARPRPFEDAGLPSEDAAGPPPVQADAGRPPAHADAGPPVGPDAGPAAHAICGNGIVEELEACDDGNRDSFDGCSDQCVVEGGRRPVFAALADLNGLDMTATAGGDVYVRSGNGNCVDSVTRIAPDGTVTLDAIPGVEQGYTHTIAAAGDTLYFGTYGYIGSSNVFMTVQRWDAAAGLATVFQQEVTDFNHNGGGWVELAVAPSGSPLYYELGAVWLVTGPATSTTYVAEEYAIRPMTYDAHLGRVLVADRGDLLRAAADGTLVPHHALPEGNIADLAVTTDGRIFAVCKMQPWSPEVMPCASGAVWVIAPDGRASRPFVDAYRTVHAIAWDPLTEDLVYLADDWKLRRTPAHP
jgi:cysteine-rich repeat protein